MPGKFTPLAVVCAMLVAVSGCGGQRDSGPLRAIEPATRRCDGSSALQSWSLASGDSVEELQFEFHRLVIQDGQAVVITAVAVKQALYTSG